MFNKFKSLTFFAGTSFIIFSLTLISFGSFAQWSPTKGPLGGEITCSGGRGNVLIAGFSANVNNYCQLFRSVDYGNSWEPVFDIKFSVFRSVTFLDSAIYVCALDSGIFISYNEGLTWQKGTANLTNATFLNATVCDNKLFACGSGVYMTDDGGVNWTPASSGLSTFYTILDIAADSMQMYAINSSEIYSSIDLGQSWQVINNGITGTDFLQIAASDSNVIIGTLSSGVYFSDDLGQTWTHVGFTTYEISDVGFRGDTLMVAIGDTIFYSGDAGVSWNNAASVGPFLYIKQFSSYGNEILVGSIGGLYSKQNLEDSCELIGVPAIDVVSMGGFGDVLFAGTIYEYGPSAGIVVSKDNGETWASANNGLPGQSLYAAKAQCFLGFGNKVLTSWRNDGLFLSTDTGLTWQQCLNGIPISRISAITIHQGIIYAINDSSQIYSSADSAQSWSLFSTLSSSTMNASAIVFRDSMIYVSTGGLGLFISPDFGQTWGTSNNGLTCLNIWSMAIKDSLIIVGTQPDGLFVSEDNGMNWSHVYLGPISPWVPAVAIVNDTIFAGTVFSQGVISSSDWGNTWSGLNDGLYNKLEILCIRKFYVNDDYLFVSTGSTQSRFSIYKRPVSQLTGQSEAPGIINELVILPNPNNGSFNLTAPSLVFGEGPVVFTVYDISGRKIFERSITTDEVFHAKALAGKSGLFIGTVSSSSTIRSKRIVVHGN